MRIGWIHRLVNKWPGKKTLGMYRFLPMFFVLGAALEFSMINWKVGEVNFYHTFKKRQAKDIVEEKYKNTQQLKMPAGATWGQYISFSVAALMSMIAGSQIVHLYYKPLVDLNKYINKELEHLPKNLQTKIKKELQDDGVLK